MLLGLIGLCLGWADFSPPADNREKGGQAKVGVLGNFWNYCSVPIQESYRNDRSGCESEKEKLWPEGRAEIGQKFLETLAGGLGRWESGNLSIGNLWVLQGFRNPNSEFLATSKLKFQKRKIYWFIASKLQK